MDEILGFALDCVRIGVIWYLKILYRIEKRANLEFLGRITNILTRPKYLYALLLYSFTQI